MRKHLIWPALLAAMAVAAPAYGSAALHPFNVEGGLSVVPGTQNQKAAWWCEIAAPGATRWTLSCSLSASGSEVTGVEFDGKSPVDYTFKSDVVQTPLESLTFCYSGVAYYADGTSKSAPTTCVTRG